MKPKEIVRSLFKSVSVLVLAAGFAVVAAIVFFLYATLKDLPDVSTLKVFRHSHATEVFSADGVKIGEFTVQRRYPIEFDKVPLHVRQAFLAAEDSRFYEHRGVDFTGVVRALLSNLLRGKYAQGGSTITQQVARSIVLVSRQKKITRKLREMVLAWRMEKELKKDEILALYLSEIYLGHGAYGIGAAAQNYFNKKVDNLDLAEAALLAGLPQRPNEWDPFHNPQQAKKRQEYVLKRMETEGMISHPQVLEALGKPLRLYELEDINNKAAPYFTEYIRVYLMNKYGSDTVLNSGYKVYTTVNYEFQKAAERAVDRGLREVDKRLGWRGVPLHLEAAIDISAMAEKIHEDVLKSLTRVRILGPLTAADSYKLSYDLSEFQKAGSPYFGPTPIKEGQYYQAVVTDIDEQKNEGRARIGDTRVQLPIAGMEWVKKKDEQPITRISEALKIGDVIEVKIDTIDRRLGTIMASLEQRPEIEGALLSADHESGAVRSMVGGKDFTTSKFNCALQSKRQVGSTFKPLLYSAAVDKGYSPSSLVNDSPIVFKFEGELDADNYGENWRPQNYGGGFKGEIPLRLALVRSMNIPTVKVLDQVSIDYVIDYVRRFGITSPFQRDLSIALGSWSTSLEEITRAYAVFPRLGRPLRLYYIEKVTDVNGNILEARPTIEEAEAGARAKDAMAGIATLEGGAVIPPDTAYVMTDMLTAVVREGTGRRAASVPGAVAGKTGTSNDHRDAWFIGYTPHIIAGVWVGYEKDKPLASRETGGVAAAPIWTEYMETVVEKYPKVPFPIPEGIVFAYVDRETGRLAASRSPTRVKVAFKEGMVPNSTGDNLLRVGEPGTRVHAATAQPNSGTAEVLPKDSETSDYLRRGYQD